jgi:hypothetical protein
MFMVPEALDRLADAVGLAARSQRLTEMNWLNSIAIFIPTSRLPKKICWPLGCHQVSDTIGGIVGSVFPDVVDMAIIMAICLPFEQCLAIALAMQWTGHNYFHSRGIKYL